MAIISVRCPVLGADVSFIRDFEGSVSQIFCPQLDGHTSMCRIKTRTKGDGPLGEFLERVSEGSLSSRTKLCLLRLG
jgi:hypothetical protein